MLQGYNESRLKSSFCKLSGRYNDLACNYKLPLAHMLNDMAKIPKSDQSQNTSRKYKSDK
jgi:hypothetical protein